MLTKDSVTVSVDAVVYYRVSNATVSVANVENAHHSTRLLAQTTLRNILGTKNLHEILSDRESISGSMQVQHYNIQSLFQIHSITASFFGSDKSGWSNNSLGHQSGKGRNVSVNWLEYLQVLIQWCLSKITNYRKDARLPVQLQRAMAAEAEAAREARAKVRLKLPFWNRCVHSQTYLFKVNALSSCYSLLSHLFKDACRE